MNNFLVTLGLSLIAVVVAFGVGYHEGEVAERERVNAAVTQEQINHAKSIAEATNSLTLASNEYDALKRERDQLVERLRNSARANGKADSLGACAARVARLEGMVERLHGLAERCDAGWHGCAARKDALSEVVK